MIKYLGWIGAGVIVAATIIRALDYSNLLDLTLTLVGCTLWACDGHVSGNKPLFAVNVFSGIVVSMGIIKHFI